MPGAADGAAAVDDATLEHGDAAVAPGEFERRCQADDAGADNDDVVLGRVPRQGSTQRSCDGGTPLCHTKSAGRGRAFSAIRAGPSPG